MCAQGRIHREISKHFELTEHEIIRCENYVMYG